MVYTKTKRKKATLARPIWYIVAAITTLVVVAVALELTHVTNFWHHTQNTPNQNGPTSEQKQQQSKTDAEQKAQAVEHPNAGSTPPPPTDSSISLSTQQLSNGTVTVTTSLGNVADGTCELTVTNGSKTTTQTADVLYQSQSSFCAGFSVPINDLGTGNWSITLKVTSGGTTVSKTVSAEVD